MPTLWTEDWLLCLMRCQDAYLQRDRPDSFIYVVDVMGGITPINQALAKQVIRKPSIYQERWREGWVEARDTGKVRWKHV